MGRRDRQRVPPSTRAEVPARADADTRQALLAGHGRDGIEYPADVALLLGTIQIRRVPPERGVNERRDLGPPIDTNPAAQARQFGGETDLIAPPAQPLG